MPKKINLFQVNSDYRQYRKSYLSKIDKVLSSGKYILGENVYKFEETLKKFTGSEYAISTSNGTDALEVSLRSLSLTSTDEVIVPSFTWISSASSIKLAGAKPVFCDIELDTYGLHHESLIKLVNKNTKAVIIVSLYGQISRDIFKIRNFCKKKKIFLIEDAAQSFGAKLDNHTSCNIADISTTSFFPTKSLGGYGDGGAIFTNDKKLALKIRHIKQNGTLDKKNFNFLGKNARLDELQAALLLERLKRFNKILKKKRENANFYLNKLKDYFNFYDVKNNYPSYSLFTIRHRKRDSIRRDLLKKGITTGVYYKENLHKMNFLTDKKYDLKNTILASKQVLSIPVNEALTKKDRQHVLSSLLISLI